MSDSPPVPVAAEVWTVCLTCEHVLTEFDEGACTCVFHPENTPEHVQLVRESELVSARELLAEERAVCEAYRLALVRIADSESGYWGHLAHDALKAAREALAVPDRGRKDTPDG